MWPISDTCTPSPVSSRFCFKNPVEAQGMEMEPFELITRCQGRPYLAEQEERTHSTPRDPCGFPASEAIWPYVATLPMGIRFSHLIT